MEPVDIQSLMEHSRYWQPLSSLTACDAGLARVLSDLIPVSVNENGNDGGDGNGCDYDYDDGDGDEGDERRWGWHGL